MKIHILLALQLISAQAFACNTSLCSGDRVVFENEKGDTGVVLEVFNNGKATVDWDDFLKNSTVPTNTLSKSVICNEYACRDNRVVFSNSKGDTGKVLEVFENGQVKVDWDDFINHSVVKGSDVGVGFRCNGDLCVHDRVVYNNAANDTGTVIEVFANGKVKVDWDSYSNNSVVKMSDLGYAIGDCR